MSVIEREGATKSGDGSAVAQEHVLFTHSDKCASLLKALLLPFTERAALSEVSAVDWSSCNEFCKILEIYQEQGHLLDPHLESLVTPLMAAIQRCSRETGIAKQHSALLSAVGKCVYTLSKVRGYKVVTKFFPHEAIDLEGCLLLLALTPPSNFDSWEARFTLFLWLSVLLLIPFNLASLDNKEGGQPLIERLLFVCESALSESSRTREPAALSLSRLLTRADTETNDLPVFLKRANAVINGSIASDALYDTRAQGFLAAVAAVFKRGDRAGLLKRVPMVLVRITDASLFATASTGLRKMMVKAAARMGLAMLPARVATWRYNRGSRSLEANLSSTTSTSRSVVTLASAAPAAEFIVPASCTFDDSQDGDAHVFVEVDRVVDALLRGLDDKDTVVRWSAAKGIGRITGRLPGHLADEIVLETLRLISNLHSDSAWHGACLALAELARRGLLLPIRLDASVTAVEKALVYDERRGSASVGSHVRDAACYVCWGFARAYEPSLLAPFLKRLAVALLQTALFDREVNCRRAASAAFQEMVGRQGSFSHGIDITQRADFFSLSNRHAAFTDIAYYVAGFEDYRVPLLERVSSAPLVHWDMSIRHLAAEGLFKLVPLDTDHTLTVIVPRLVSQATDSDLCVRHGCIIGLAAVVKAITSVSIAASQMDYILSTATASILSCCSHQVIKSRGSELTRQAVCSLVTSLCFAASRIDDPVFDTIKSFVLECFVNAVDDVRSAGLAALRSLNAHFEQRPVESNSIAVVCIENASQLGIGSMEVRASCRGSIAALASLPLSVMPSSLLSRVVLAVCDAAKGIVSNSEIVDIESRSTACEALSSLVESGALVRDAALVEPIISALHVSLNDYSVDKRGDIGSLVRESSMSAFFSVLTRILTDTSNSGGQLSGTLAAACISSIFRQCFEKIDRVRAHAGAVSAQLCVMVYVQQAFPICSKVISSQNIDWINAATAFSFAVDMLSEQSVRQSLCEGIVVSCGGVGESVARGGWNALKTWLIANKGHHSDDVCSCILQLLSIHQSCDRIVMPTLRLLNIMLSDGEVGACMAELKHGTLLSSCIDWTCAEAKKCSDVSKLCALIDILAACSGLRSNFTVPCIKYMTITLSHRLPRVSLHVFECDVCSCVYPFAHRCELTALTRSTRLCSLPRLSGLMRSLPVKTCFLLFLSSIAAECLASCVILGADVDSAGVALASASWSGGVAEVKTARAEVAAALKIELPAPAAVAVKKAANISQEKGEGYGTLVRDMGY